MDSQKKPKLIAFDLDRTLWPCILNKDIFGPFHEDENGMIVNIQKQIVLHYKESTTVLERLYKEGYTLAVVSRSWDPTGAKQLLQLFKWEHYFTYVEIYNKCKAIHFQRIKEVSKLEYKEMLIFDDDEKNKRDLDTIGVRMIKVCEGISEELITKGLKDYSDNYVV